MNNDEKAYSALLADITNAMAKGSITLADSPELKKLIDKHLGRYDGQLASIIKDFIDKTNDDKKQLNNLSVVRATAIKNKGGHELQRLKTYIHKEFDDDALQRIVNNTINNQVAQIINKSKTQIAKSYNKLDQDFQLIGSLDGRINDLNKRLDKMNRKVQDSKKNLWYGIFIAFIIGALSVWVFMAL